MAQNQHSIAGLILAGGRGERLGGVIKSELVIGGVRLLERVAERLAACSPLLVGHGRIDPAALHLSAGMNAVPDLQGDYAGPLPGLAGAVAYLNAMATPPELLVSVAVDTPFLPPDFVTRLVDGLGEAPAAIAAYGEQPYPTNAAGAGTGRNGTTQSKIAVFRSSGAHHRVAERRCRRSLRQRQHPGRSGQSAAASDHSRVPSRLSFRDRKFGLGKGNQTR